MKKKLTAVALVVCMLAIMLVGASLAYFTDKDTETNTFTMGKVDIELSEPNWDTADGNKDGSMKVFPGVTYAKDPTITVVEGSEDCYLIATVTIEKRAALYALYANDESGIKQDWGLSLAGNGKLVSGGVAGFRATPATEGDKQGTMLSVDDTDVAFVTYEEDIPGDKIIYTYFFKHIHTAGSSEILFTEVNVPSIIKDQSLSGLKVTVNAYAIQAAGMTDVYDAWTKYDGNK